INVHAWKVKIDCLPTRLNISRRDILRKISRWWDIEYTEIASYEEWLVWILNIPLSRKHKQLFEGASPERAS
ncbi:hypothetical protein Tco_1259963, partial [Tanacetum coccineum]